MGRWHAWDVRECIMYTAPACHLFMSRHALHLLHAGGNRGSFTNHMANTQKGTDSQPTVALPASVASSCNSTVPCKQHH